MEGRDTTSLVMKFVEVLGEAASSDLHIGYRYSRMLRKLWLRYEQRASGRSPTSDGVRNDSTANARKESLTARHSFSGISPSRVPLYSRVNDSTGLQSNGNGSVHPNRQGEASANGIPTPDLYDPDAALMNSHLFAPFAPELFSGSTSSGDELGPMQALGSEGGVPLSAGGLNYFDPWGMPVSSSGGGGSSWFG